MRKILICTNPDRDINLGVTEKLRDMIGARAEVMVRMIHYAGIRAEDAGKLSRDLKKMIAGADLAVAIGGDGTIMHAARAAAPYGKPVLGINKGHKGFLADLDETNLGLFERVISGDFEIDSRMMLDVSIQRGGKTIFGDFAINDAVMSGLSRMVSVSVYANGIKIAKFSGDGVIIASPTGSTAYSMSAGGPIIEPAAKNIVITPICSHALIAKPFVLADDKEITAKVNSPGGIEAYAVVDGGQGIKLEAGDILKIKKSKYETRLIKVTDKSFYETVSEKLGEI